jgi:hypothetical protein
VDWISFPDVFVQEVHDLRVRLDAVLQLGEAVTLVLEN